MTSIRIDRDNPPRSICFLCGNAFPHGFGQYRGTGAWGVRICDGCYESNSDAIVPQSYPKLAEHLKVCGITPRTNKKGYWLWPE